MIISSKTEQAVICIEEQALSGVKKIAEKVAGDLQTLTGKKFPVTVLGQEDKKAPHIVAATLGKSDYLTELEKQGRFDSSKIAGKWEVYAFTLLAPTAEEPYETLLIAGSDKRGTIYGLFHISEMFGVSPWVWFADAVPVKKEDLVVTEKDCFISKVPSVKYRGFFINDEWPSFGNWTFRHFNGFTVEMYEHVFELLLRLKGNYLWPAMWTSNFSCDGPGMANAILADELGVVMSNSHHEPCLRHSEEWDQVKGDDTPYGTAWNFDKNREGLTNYWRDGLKRNGHLENIITMGMRGERDSEILATATLKDNIDYLKDVITVQNQLIKETISENLDDTLRMLAIYKEVERYFHGDEQTEGLKTWDGLDGITCMLCEDNFGNLRTLPEEGQRDRKGGWGMYYHFDYHGDPVSYEWVNSTHIARTCEQMSQAYDYGIRDIWIVNVGDLKPQEFPLSYFLDLAYDMDKWGTSNPDAVTEYTRKWVKTQFPALSAMEDDIVTLLEGYTRTNYIRKPEALGTKTYHTTNYGEAKAMLARAEALDALAGKLWNEVQNLPEKSSFYQLIYYPVVASMNLLKLQLTAGQNHMMAESSAVLANDKADLMRQYLTRDKELMDLYHTNNDGKWDGMMMSEHIGFAHWNDEECRKPIQMTIEAANKPRMIVSAGNSEVYSMGGDWTRKVLSIPAFLDPTVRESSITVRNGAEKPFTCRLVCDAPWLVIENKEVTVDKEEVIAISIDRSKIADAGAEFAPTFVKATIRVESDFAHVDTVVYGVKVSGDAIVPVLPEEFFKEEAGRNGRNVVNELGLVLDITEDVVLKDGTAGKYAVLKGLGKYENAIKAFPTTTYFTAGKDAPYAEFTFALMQDQEVEISLLTAPGNPVVKNNRMSLGLSVNDGEIQTIPTVSEGYDGGERRCRDWGEGVMNQIHDTKVLVSGKAGKNTLRIYAIDPGVVVERILVRQGGSSWSKGYLGKLPSWI